MKTILIVEDMKLNRDLMVQLLEEDYRLLIACDGDEAVSLVREERPDIVLMDLSLPRVDGWEATRRIKEDGTLAHIPVIAITAHAMQGEDFRASESGCDDYLSKPIDEQLLFDKLDAFLGRESGDGPG